MGEAEREWSDKDMHSLCNLNDPGACGACAHAKRTGLVAECVRCHYRTVEIARKAGARIAELERQVAKARAAVTYLLDRTQERPPERYYLGHGSQSFYLLIQAEAAFLGQSLGEVEERRKVCLVPKHRWSEHRWDVPGYASAALRAIDEWKEDQPDGEDEDNVAASPAEGES